MVGYHILANVVLILCHLGVHSRQDDTVLKFQSSDLEW